MVAPPQLAQGHGAVGAVVRGGHRVLGVDEAGRGAVLGPLVVAGVLAEEGARERLRTLGARDSKTVARDRRQDILRKLAREAEGCWAIVYSARAVDGCSLTTLEENAVSAMITRLSPQQVVIDSPVSPAAVPALLGRLRSSTNGRVEITAYPKADVCDPVVGAASLLAKVVRDGYMHVLRSQYGDLGWGYPGEAKVKRFLETWVDQHGRLPTICRTRWKGVYKAAGARPGMTTQLGL